MIKPELVRNIVNKYVVGETEAAYLVDNIFTAMSNALSKGKNINIPEFGKFKIVYRMINGSRTKCVTFSPVRKFAEFINDDFNNLDSQITKVISLKNSDMLTVRELMPDENDEEYLCFIFEENPDTYIPSDISPYFEEIPENKFPVQTVSEKTTNNITKNISGKIKDTAIGTLPEVVTEEPIDNEKAFELPGTRRKIVHDLKDDFSIEDTDIADLTINKEEILNKTLPPETETSKDDIIITSKTDDIIIPFGHEADEIDTDEKEITHKLTETDSQIAKNKQDEATDDLTESINKLEVHESNNAELLIFQKLLRDDTAEVKQKPELTGLKPLYEEIEPEPEISSIKSEEIISQEEPKSLNDALENLQTDRKSMHIDSNRSKEPESFNEVFVNKESRYGAKQPLKNKKVKKISGFLKVLFYIFFIIMFGIVCFYIFDIIFKKSDNKGIIENVRKPSVDTLNKQFASDEKVKGESVQVDRVNGAVYRKLGSYFYIEYNLYQSINEASDKEAKLKSNMISCKVEAVMTIDNTIEYRVLVGPFETLETAKEYHKEYKSILDSVI